MDPFKFGIQQILMTQFLNTSSNANEIKVDQTDYPIKLSENQRIALQRLELPYYIQNIKSTYNNHQIQYIWVDGTTNTITLDDGMYSISKINDAIHTAMRANTHYQLDSTGKEVYHISFYQGSVYAKFVFRTIIVSTSYANPAGVTWSSTNTTPQVTFMNNNLSTYNLGFTPATVPTTPQSTTYEKLSDTIPNITSFTSIYVDSDLADNSISSIPLRNTLAVFTPDVNVEELLVYEPKNLQYFKCVPNTFRYVNIRLRGENILGELVDLPLIDINAMKAIIQIISKVSN